tara:strand:- start:6623 stop:7036 length:414 start_codon:yes stop_codon:yes gene_type:complete
MSLLKNSKSKSRRLVIEYVAGADLMPNEYNPNVHDATSFDLLVRSLGYFGFTQPIVVDRATNEIIDGENRWRAAAVLGIDEVPVCYVELNDAERKTATIIHNRARGSEVEAQIAIVEQDIREADDSLSKSVLLKGRI